MLQVSTGDGWVTSVIRPKLNGTYAPAPHNLSFGTLSLSHTHTHSRSLSLSLTHTHTHSQIVTHTHRHSHTHLHTHLHTHCHADAASVDWGWVGDVRDSAQAERDVCQRFRRHPLLHQVPLLVKSSEIMESVMIHVIGFSAPKNLRLARCVDKRNRLGCSQPLLCSGRSVGGWVVGGVVFRP